MWSLIIEKRNFALKPINLIVCGLVDAYKLYNKFKKYRRNTITNLDNAVIENFEDGGYRELMATYSEDIKTNLKLTFVKITRKARKWRSILLKSKSQPVVFPRNGPLYDEFQKYLDLSSKGLCEKNNFMKYIVENSGFQIFKR